MGSGLCSKNEDLAYLSKVHSLSLSSQCCKFNPGRQNSYSRISEHNMVFRWSKRHICTRDSYQHHPGAWPAVGEENQWLIHLTTLATQKSLLSKKVRPQMKKAKCLLACSFLCISTVPNNILMSQAKFEASEKLAVTGNSEPRVPGLSLPVS